MSGLVEVIKEAAMAALHQLQPCDVLFGTVSKVEPLTINTDNQMELKKPFLVLASSVTGENALQIGERVILLKKQGGQQFVVTDRIGDEE